MFFDYFLVPLAIADVALWVIWSRQWKFLRLQFSTNLERRHCKSDSICSSRTTGYLQIQEIFLDQFPGILEELKVCFGWALFYSREYGVLCIVWWGLSPGCCVSGLRLYRPFAKSLIFTTHFLQMQSKMVWSIIHSQATFLSILQNITSNACAYHWQFECTCPCLYIETQSHHKLALISRASTHAKDS